MYEIREGREEDRHSVVELLTKIFRPVESFRDEWVYGWREFWNRPTSKNWAFVATHMGRVVANLSFFKSNVNRIRANPVWFGGVWAVGTELEHRRQGLLKELFQRAFPTMNEQGIVLSILDPSPYQGAQIAYEKCGYAVAERRVKHIFPPNALRSPEENSDITVRKLECRGASKGGGSRVGHEPVRIKSLYACMACMASHIRTCNEEWANFPL